MKGLRETTPNHLQQRRRSTVEKLSWKTRHNFVFDQISHPDPIRRDADIDEAGNPRGQRLH